MSARWPTERNPKESPGHGCYRRAQVLEAERWAWAGKVQGGRAEFFYDGVGFWRQGSSGGLRAVTELETPAEGWWHKPDCNCAPCSAHVHTSPEALTEWARVR